MRSGFNNFENCLNVYLDQLSNISSVDDSKVTGPRKIHIEVTSDRPKISNFSGPEL